MKGRANYVSIRRALQAQGTPATSLFDAQRQAELAGIVDWLSTTKDGSLSDLSFRPSAEVWDEVASETDVCLRAKCPHFEDCFYQRARREASAADVLVVNHHLLFSDLAVRRALGNYTAPAVLPQYTRLVLDEAHNLEEAATSHLGARVSRRGLFRTLRRLEQPRQGADPLVRHRAQGGAQRPDRPLRARRDRRPHPPGADGARERAANVFSHLGDLFTRRRGDHPAGGSFAAHPVWPLGLDDALTGVLDNLRSLTEAMELLRERVSVTRRCSGGWRRAHGAARRRQPATAAGDALRQALRPGEEELQMVRWIERQAERDGREGNLTLNAAPLDLAKVLRESLFEQVPTVILTSATLATQGNFRFVRQRLGLTGAFADEHHVEEAIHPSPFDFGRQSLLAVPTDLPLPAGDRDDRHDEATVRGVIEHARSATAVCSCSSPATARCATSPASCAAAAWTWTGRCSCTARGRGRSWWSASRRRGGGSCWGRPASGRGWTSPASRCAGWSSPSSPSRCPASR